MRKHSTLNPMSALDLRFAWDRKSVRYAPAGEGEGGEGGEGSGEGDGSSGSGAGEGSEGKKPEPTINDPEKKKLSDEAAKYRTELRAEQVAKKELEDRLKAIEDKDKTELEKAQRDLTETSEKIKAMEALVQRQALEVAWVQSGASALFKNPSVAFKLIDTSKLEVKDGVVEQKAIKELADALAKSGDVVLSDSGEGEGEGTPSGAPTNGRSGNGKTDASKALLEKKFPALRGR